DREPDLTALLDPAQLVVLDPAIAVAADVVTRLGDRLRRGRVALQRECAPVHGHRELALGERAVDPPEPGTAAVPVDRLDGEVAFAGPEPAERHLRENRLRDVVVGDRVLRALFVVQDEIDREPRTPWPLGIGRTAAVADHVARIGLLAHRSSLVR